MTYLYVLRDDAVTETLIGFHKPNMCFDLPVPVLRDFTLTRA